MEEKYETLTFRHDSELVKKLREISLRESLSLSDVLIRISQQYLQFSKGKLLKGINTESRIVG